MNNYLTKVESNFGELYLDVSEGKEILVLDKLLMKQINDMLEKVNNSDSETKFKDASELVAFVFSKYMKVEEDIMINGTFFHPAFKKKIKELLN